eukprot:gnl/Dysnectes_brevis/972_a1082_2190.p1 GENE.gnl/Dysnectes_brevis/972_a1082_2190~~gnl/Dysnectes_brevis/972_a1082_2190.p1  ORF type:complete len:511 (+),score=163.03 gnl/Dysnectes_brevis/972_a1082_2190:39-1571(+)
MTERSDDEDHTQSLLHQSLKTTMPPDSLYQVKKISSFRRIQDRHLKLTRNAILNIRNGDRVTVEHIYSDVMKVVLHDTDNLTIKYFNDHDFRYRSPLAVQIVADIQQRVIIYNAHTRRSTTQLMKTVALNPELIKALSPTGAFSTFGTPTAHSPTATRQSATPTPDGQEEPEVFSDHSDRSLEMGHPGVLGAGGDSPIGSPLQPGSSVVKTRNKLAALTGSTESERLRVQADRITFAGKGEEGLSVSKFVARFRPDKFKGFQEASKRVRSYVDAMRAHIIERSSHRSSLTSLQVLSEHTVIENGPSAVPLDRVVGNSLERAVITQLFPALWKMASDDNRARDRHIFESSKQLQKFPQSFFEIKQAYQDPSNFEAAVLELRELESEINTFPWAFFSVLIDTITVIQATVNLCSRAGRDRAPDSPPLILGAEDMLPIFMFVFVRAGLQRAATVSEFLVGLGDPSLINSEFGYALVTFDCASSYVTDLATRLENPEDSMRLTPDQIDFFPPSK